MVRKMLKLELRLPHMNIGRLLLLQCPRKIEKYKSEQPKFKTTRPISITPIYQKILEHILLSRIKSTIVKKTSRDNAGFKPKMSC